jgi:hypothetical protein
MPVRLFAREEGGTSVALLADSTGRLVVSVQQGCEERTRAFGPLLVPGAARVVLMLTWSSDGISLSLNDVELRDRVASATELRIRAADVGVPTSGPLFPGLQLRAGLSDADELFLSTIIDLDKKLAAGDRYSLIRASGLLRQLLVDETPLVHTVNRQHHLDLAFRTMDFAVPPPVEPEAHWRVLDPDPFPGAQTQTCSLKQFLAAPCLTWKGRCASVTDLIRACANVKGGIHLGRTKIADEQLLLDWDEVFTILGEEPSLKAIAAVCRVALRGLSGLVTAVHGGR